MIKQIRLHICSAEIHFKGVVDECMLHIKPPCFIKSSHLCILRFPSTNNFRLVTIYCGSCCIAQTETVLAAFSNEQTSQVDMQFRLVAF